VRTAGAVAPITGVPEGPVLNIEMTSRCHFGEHASVPSLVRPDSRYHEDFVAAVAESDTVARRVWITPQADRSLNIADAEDFAGYVTQLLQETVPGSHLPDRWMPHTTLWWVDGSRVLGTVDIRHALTPELTEVGGHIGYGVRPSMRRRGHGTAILRNALWIAHGLGLDRVLVTCDDDNVGSIRIIEANGGILEDQRGRKLRYWVATTGTR
jgi:predicted acetyltransferase